MRMVLPGLALLLDLFFADFLRLVDERRQAFNSALENKPDRREHDRDQKRSAQPARREQKRTGYRQVERNRPKQRSMELIRDRLDPAQEAREANRSVSFQLAIPRSFLFSSTMASFAGQSSSSVMMILSSPCPVIV